MATTTTTITTQKTLPIIFLISLFLITIFLFTKHTLDPNLPIYTPKSETEFINLDPISKPPFLETNLNNSELITNDSISKTESGFVDSDSVEENPGFEIQSNDLILEKERINFNKDEVGLVKKSVEWGQNCNMHSGKWVKDEEYPVYKSGSCPFVDEAFNCQSNGRIDEDYMKWRWEPDECQLPRLVLTV